MTRKLKIMVAVQKEATRKLAEAIFEEFPKGCEMHAFLNANQKKTTSGTAITNNWTTRIRIRLPGETRRGCPRTKPVELANCFHEPQTRA